MSVEYSDENLYINRGKGTYILILHLLESGQINVGRFGVIPFKTGYYAYVGSAFGAGGLAARLNHHLSISTRLRWHIDYLRQEVPVEQIWFSESSQKLEHDWARLLSQMDDARIAVEGFGASDCRCPSHLFYFRCCPAASELGDDIRSISVQILNRILNDRSASFQSTLYENLKRS